MGQFFTHPLCRYVVAGQLTRDYLILPDGSCRYDLPGGSALYACAGLALWDNQISILSRVSSDYPTRWLEQFAELGIDPSGIQIAEDEYSMIQFQAFSDWSGTCGLNPIHEFSRRNLTMPGSLLEWQKNRYLSDQDTNSNPAATFHISGIHSHHSDASNFLLLPMPGAEQEALLAEMNSSHFPFIGFFPASSWMQPLKVKEFSKICANVRTLFLTLDDLNAMYAIQKMKTWEMIEAISEYCKESVVIYNQFSGGYLYCKETRKKFCIPAYPFTRRVNPVGSQFAFCGGYAAGRRNAYDPLEAYCYGEVSSSTAMEALGGFSALTALRELLPERLRLVSSLVKQC
ncbi:MAG: carbohydrate kinase family protein [Anaerolineae bacterium]|nr:carbohydrate kinase family protein [Anaerolineae bacterium]